MHVSLKQLLGAVVSSLEKAIATGGRGHTTKIPGAAAHDLLFLKEVTLAGRRKSLDYLF